MNVLLLPPPSLIDRGYSTVNACEHNFERMELKLFQWIQAAAHAASVRVCVRACVGKQSSLWCVWWQERCVPQTPFIYKLRIHKKETTNTHFFSLFFDVWHQTWSFKYNHILVFTVTWPYPRVKWVHYFLLCYKCQHFMFVRKPTCVLACVSHLVKGWSLSMQQQVRHERFVVQHLWAAAAHEGESLYKYQSLV